MFKDNDISIPTALSLNGRIFVSPKEHIDALVSNFFQNLCWAHNKKINQQGSIKFEFLDLFSRARRCNRRN